MQVSKSTTIPFTTEAMKANLLRLRNEWETVQSSRERAAIYVIYLSGVFELVEWWAEEGHDVEYARRALGLQRDRPDLGLEPFSVVIFCTSDRHKVDDKTRSKWSRVLRYAAEFKRADESLAYFVKRKGGINKCAARFTRRLGRGSSHENAKQALQARR